MPFGFDAALALLEERGVLMLASHRTLPSLATAVTGEHVRGSWWGHARGGEIYDLANRLEDASLVTKLVEGKVTFVAPRLHAALLRVVLDPAHRRACKLDAEAISLLAKVQRMGELRLGEVKASKGARNALEIALLVRSAQVHTASGKHATVLSRWDRWASGALRSEAAALSLADALVGLRVATAGTRTAFDEL